MLSLDVLRVFAGTKLVAFAALKRHVMQMIGGDNEKSRDWTQLQGTLMHTDYYYY